MQRVALWVQIQRTLKHGPIVAVSKLAQTMTQIYWLFVTELPTPLSLASLHH